MGADIAEQVTPVPMSPTLGQTLTRAAQYAQDQSHVEVSLEHLLLSLTEDDDARQVMMSSGVDIDALQTDVSQQIGRIDARLTPGEEATASISEELRRILNAAAVAARAGRRAMIDGAIVLAAIIGDAKTSAAGLLKAHGLTFEVAINVIRQANRPAPSAPPSNAAPGRNDAPAQQRTAGETPPGTGTAPEPANEPPAPSPAAVAVPATPPQNRLGGASDILAEARNRIASRKVAGYSDRIAARNAADDELPRGEAPPQTAAIEEAYGKAPPSDSHGGIGEVAPNPLVANRDAPVPEQERAIETTAANQETAAEAAKKAENETADAEPAGAPAPEPVPDEPASQAPPPPAPPRVEQTLPIPQPPRQPPSTPPHEGRSWAPPPSGPRPPPAGPPPRGAPPPIPPAMPSRPPAPVSTGRPPVAAPRPPNVDAPPPPQQLPQREPPWTGPPTAPPPQRPADTPPGSAAGPGPAPARAPLPSPDDVFSANARTRQQAGRPPPPQREPAPRGPPPERPQPKRERAPEAANSPTVLPGQLIENVPRRMRVGISSAVEVRIAKAEVKAISDGLDLNATHRHDIQVTKAMSVRLRAPEGGFFIETASPETQWIENALGLMADDYARWRWMVTPKLRGKRKLQLIVSARTVGPDGLAAETALPDQIIEIKVSTNYAVVAKRTAGWAIAAVLGGLLAQFGSQIWTALEPLLRSLTQ